jgi:hypothetical protein
MVIAPRPFGQVLADAMNSLARTWKTLLLPAIAVSVPVSVITIAVFRLTGGADLLDLVVNSPEQLTTMPREVFVELARPFYWSMAASTLVLVLGGVFIVLATHRTVASDLNGIELTGAQAARHALSRYPAGLGAVLLVLLALVILLGLGFTVWLLPALRVGTPNSTSLIVALVLLFVLIGPGIWAGVSMSMTTSAIIIEDTGALSSIRRSMHLVRGRWWPTAAFLLMVGLLGGIAIQLIQLVALPLAASGGGNAALTIAAGLGVLTQGLLMAGIAAMYTHWYVDLRARREPVSTTDLG